MSKPKQAVETFVDSNGIKTTRTHLKRRIEQFYTDSESDTVFVLYEDTEGNIHYQYCNYDTERYKMCVSCFNKEFKRLEE